MKKIIVCLVFLLIVSSCSGSSNNIFESKTQKYCEKNGCKDIEIVHQINIDGVGSYAIIRVSRDNQEYFIFGSNNEGGGSTPGGMNGFGPAFIGSNCNVLENLDSLFGNNYDYYIYMMNEEVDSANYNGKPLEVEKSKTTLNGNSVTISSWIIKLKVDEKNDENLLELY